MSPRAACFDLLTRSLQCLDTVRRVTGRTSLCCYGDGGDVTGALHVLEIWLSPFPLPSSLAATKSRIIIIIRQFILHKFADAANLHLIDSCEKKRFYSLFENWTNYSPYKVQENHGKHTNKVLENHVRCSG